VTAPVDLPPQAGMARHWLRVSRHLNWARNDGISRLVEEDGLDLRDRVGTAARKWRWRRAQGAAPGTAVAVFLVGVQRSGTNMIVRGLEAAPEFEVRNENDRSVFDCFQLRPLPEVRQVVARSRHRFVLFKPLCDSHRTAELVDEMTTARPARALWAYRAVDGRAASAVAKFGDVNLRVMRGIAEGRGAGWWQAQCLSDEVLDFVRSFDYETLSPLSAAALFWYVRNNLVFDLGLDRRPDVALVSYEAIVADPEPRMREICDFLGFEWSPSLIAHIDRRSPSGRRVDIDPRIRSRCDALQSRLDNRRVR
jgi:Sulfotransferase domain